MHTPIHYIFTIYMYLHSVVISEYGDERAPFLPKRRFLAAILIFMTQRVATKGWHDVDTVHVRRIQPAAPLRLFARVLFQRTCDVTVLSSFVFQVKGVMFYSYSVCGETM